ncbi:MAG: universal stress protein [Chitinophagales bacterium]
MKKILIPTDFSGNSKSGIHYAMKWSSVHKIELVFIHVIHLSRPVRWSDSRFKAYADDETAKYLSRLEKFITAEFKNMKIKPGKHSFVIQQGINATKSILDYCRNNNDIDCICISTKGASKYDKYLGTNTGNLITKSKIPVLAIPKNYKAGSITKILYASDFKNYTKELDKVLAFALPFKAPVDVLHFSVPDELLLDEKTIETVSKKKYKHGVTVHVEKNPAIHSLLKNLLKQIKKRNPSIVIMFTNQERTFFQKLIHSSKTEALSFQLKTPLMVFNKTSV